MGGFVQQLINGLSRGSIYALIALGYTMVYGIIKLINFAHGDILMIGAFLGYVCATVLKIPFIPALLITVTLCAVLGMAIEKVAYKPLRNAPRITLLITAIGISFLLEYVAMTIFGAESVSYPEGYFVPGSLKMGNIQIGLDKIVVIISSVCLMILLQFIVKNTKIGRAMRAVSSDKDAASLMGISIDRTISITFVIGSALAGFAGIMYGAMFKTNALMGMQPGIKAFTAAVFGGIGSIPGAMIGGVTLGMLEAFISGYVDSKFVDAVAFAVLIIVLLVRPHGLLGKDTREKV